MIQIPCERKFVQGAFTSQCGKGGLCDNCKILKGMKWKPGLPKAVGLYVCETNSKEYITAEIEWYEPDEGNRYLTISIDDDVEELNDPDNSSRKWIKRHYGPISLE